MNEAAGRTDIGTPPAVQGDVDRIEALEQQVRQLTSRLAGWVEAQLVQEVDDRRDEMEEFRAELRAQADSLLSVAIRRMEVAQKQLSERLDTVAGQPVHDEVKAALATAEELQRAELEELRAELTSRLAGASGATAANEALDQRLRSAMSRLSESVDTRLRDAAQARRTELEALAEDIVALKTEGYAGPARIEAFEQRVKAAMGRLTDSVEKRLSETASNREAGLGAVRLELTAAIGHQVTSAVATLSDSVDARLAELATARAAEIEGLRAELAAAATALGERVEATGQRTAAVADSLSGLRSEAEAAATRTDGLEQRVKAAVGRLAESVESRLAELAAGQSAELREGMDIVATALRARMAEVQERVEAVEEHGRESETRIGAVVEGRLGEILERRRVEFDEVKAELEAGLASQLREARSEIGTAVADAHRRFVVSVDKLHERMNVVADQSTAAHTAATRIETLQETLTSDGRRIEALEIHTRRTDARLGDVVDAKLAEQRGAELEGVQDQLRAALDAHLVETRAEVTLALGQGRQELIDSAARIEARQDALDRQVAESAAGLDAIDASVATGLREVEERLRVAVETRLAAFEAVAAQLAEDRAELASTVASIAAQLAENREELASTVASMTRKVARAQDQAQRKVATVADRVDALARAAAVETGSLAPLRSDLRLLQAQVADLAELAATVRPRKAAVPAKKAAKRAPAAPAKKTLAKKPVAKKVAAPAPAAKASRPRRSQ